MAGWDTLRGVSFQHAVALLAAVDVLEAQYGGELQIESDADIIDLDVLTDGVRCSVQVRSRQEPYNWPPAELASVLGALIEGALDEADQFRFVTDGPLSSESARTLMPAIRRLAAGDASDEDASYVNGLGLTTSEELLSRLEIQTRVGSTTALLAVAGTRMLSLLAASGTTTVAESEDAIARLFQAIAVPGGAPEIEKRTFSREDLAGIAGVDLDAVDAGDEWDHAVRERYLATVVSEGTIDVPLAAPEPAITTSGALLALGVVEEGLSGGEEITFGSGLDVSNLANTPLLGLIGDAGSGKSTSLRFLGRQLAADGALPLLMSAGSYIEGDLLPRVQRLIERQVGRPLRPHAADRALADERAVLMIDGLTGLATEAELALLRDVRRLQERIPTLRLVSCDRNARLLHKLGLTIWELRSLDREKRRELAVAIVGESDADEALHEIQQRLPDAAGSPLLLTMALRLRSSGVKAGSRSALYSAAIDALRARADTVVTDSELAAITKVALALVEAGQYEADRYWWLLAIRNALDVLADGGLYEVAETPAESVIESGIGVGLLIEQPGEATVTFLHDSFRDYLAAASIERDPNLLPSALTESWEPATVMIAEAAGVSARLADAARSNIVSCAKLAPFDRDSSGERAREVAALLRSLIERHLGRSPDVTRLDHAKLLVCYETAYRYVLVHAGVGDDRVVDADELAAAAEQSSLVFAFPPDRGPLSIAFGAWRELLALTILDERLGPSRAIPKNDKEILALIVADFRERRTLLDELADAIAPTLKERIVAELGWNGLTARLGQSQPTGLRPPYMTSARWLFLDRQYRRRCPPPRRGRRAPPATADRSRRVPREPAKSERDGGTRKAA
jgi:hypothetical protein